jgi:hypothetical protein
MQPKKTPFGSCHYRTHDGIHVLPDGHSTIILMHRTLCLRAFPVPCASFPCYEESFSGHDNSGPPFTVYPYNHIVLSTIKRRRTYAVFHTTTSGLDAVSSNKTSRRRLIVSGFFFGFLFYMPARRMVILAGCLLMILDSLGVVYSYKRNPAAGQQVPPEEICFLV